MARTAREVTAHDDDPHANSPEDVGYITPPPATPPPPMPPRLSDIQRRVLGRVERGEDLDRKMATLWARADLERMRLIAEKREGGWLMTAAGVDALEHARKLLRA